MDVKNTLSLDTEIIDEKLVALNCNTRNIAWKNDIYTFFNMIFYSLSITQDHVETNHIYPRAVRSFPIFWVIKFQNAVIFSRYVRQNSNGQVMEILDFIESYFSL